jgi:hypothetical protein
MNRRVFLRGAGTLLALPLFESLGLGKAAPATSVPRFCFLYVPNGMSMQNWRPAQLGPLSATSLPSTLRPLADHLEYITVASGLDNRASEKAGRPEALGEHARSIGAFLSAVYPSRDLRAGETIDVIFSRTIGSNARIPLLNLATEYAEDQHDLGYSEVFNYSLSWKSEDTPIQPVESPLHAFELLCGNAHAASENAQAARDRRAAGKSVLDAVLENARGVQAKLNTNDRRTFEEYLESVRSIERSIGQSAAGNAAKACGPESSVTAEPSSYDERMKIMLDLLYLALQSGSTQVATLLMGAERSERDFGFLSERAGFDMSGGHHSTSHHRNKPAQIRRYAQINAYHSECLARFLQKLKTTPDGEGNLLDHTFIVYGSAMSDGNSHEHYNLPLLFAGKGNGLIDPGRHGFHIDYGSKPLSNLYLTLLQRMSVTDSGGNFYSFFGDSGGVLDLPGGH